MRHTTSFCPLIFSRACMLIGGIILASLFLSLPVQAASTHIAQIPQTIRHAAASRTAAAPMQVTVFVLDMSSFMKEDDPANQRCATVDAYLALSGPAEGNRPGDVIGVIGLDSQKNAGEDTSHFQQAMTWVSPTEIDTPQQREVLQQTIVQASNNCQPDGAVPTYDALLKARAMLVAAAKKYGTISGSVILLTGEEPTDEASPPDTASQEQAISSKIVPSFKRSHWSIDTIALSADARTHDFLHTLSSSTDGTLYQNDERDLPGVSPSNILSTISSIFDSYHYLSPSSENNQPISLSSAGYSTDYNLNDFTSKLDIVVSRQQAQTVVSLTDPDGYSYSSDVRQQYFDSSVDVETDPSSYYVIFTVQKPLSGQWVVSISGKGSVLLNSFEGYELQITPSLLEPQPLLLGQPFSVAATITNTASTPNPEDGLVVYATITDMADGHMQRSIPLVKKGSGMYEGTMGVLLLAPAGLYTITVCVPFNGNNLNGDPSGHYPCIATAQLSNIKLERFPTPLLLNQRGQAVSHAVSYTVDERDWASQILYALPFSVGRWWPLSSITEPVSIHLSCLIEWQGKLYPGERVKVVIKSIDSVPTTVMATVNNDDEGHVQITLPPQTPADTYTISFSMSGSRADSLGDTHTVERTIRIIRPVPSSVWLARGLLTFYLLVVIVVFMLFLLCFGKVLISHPSGVLMDEEMSSYSFAQVQYNQRRWFFGDHKIKPEKIAVQPGQQQVPPGLEVRFKAGRVIEVRSTGGKDGKHWKSKESRPLTKNFQQISVLEYQPEKPEAGDRNRIFIIDARSERSTRRKGQKTADRRTTPPDPAGR